MVYELITASGSNKPGEENFHGAVNFLIGNMEENGVNATAKTAKLFLGLQVQCTQCHNHPFNDWKQNQFWELNAFFRQTKARNEDDTQEARRACVPGEQEFRRRKPKARRCDSVLRAAQRPIEVGVSGVRRRPERFRTAASSAR